MSYPIIPYLQHTYKDMLITSTQFTNKTVLISSTVYSAASLRPSKLPWRYYSETYRLGYKYHKVNIFNNAF